MAMEERQIKAALSEQFMPVVTDGSPAEFQEIVLQEVSSSHRNTQAGKLKKKFFAARKMLIGEEKE